MSFEPLGLIPALLRALAEEGYETPTPIQLRTIPRLLEGRDLLGCAQTGTGKTAAFALPVLQRLGARPASPVVRCLVLAPTRELASQIGESFGAYGRHLPLRHTVIFGGVSQLHQERALRERPDVVVATPGRLLDLIGQRLVDLSRVEVLVLDEADRMLDMGFIHDVRKIVAQIPKARQTLLFSATMPREVADLAAQILRDPLRVDVAPERAAADTVTQGIYHCPRGQKRALLEQVLRDPAVARVLVFTRTKHGANRVVKQLATANIVAEAIHGNKSQGARERALDGFRTGRNRVLVATDIAARGIDVDGVTHVVNYDLPHEPESYVHRIGRTGRAGASGVAISFCDDAEEGADLAQIERLIGRKIPVLGRVERAPGAAADADPPSERRGDRGGGRRGPGGR
ncbi:MAG: DEAD/DEAH box helicase, partial [Deltaproteobacteria bacterium]|nr:DEAD/DEAH box helicase [Deltaproteobacteria bacterium]